MKKHYTLIPAFIFFFYNLLFCAGSNRKKGWEQNILSHRADRQQFNFLFEAKLEKYFLYQQGRSANILLSKKG